MKRMEFTFGIITSDKSTDYVDNIIRSIYNMDGIGDESFEIVIVGGHERVGKNVIHIPFDNSPRIALKKNLITEKSSKENIVFLHDYFEFDTQWYLGFLEFGNHWDICMNMILNMDGRRFRDWITWDAPENQTREGKSGLLAPYSYDKFKYMYISGGYWVAKKEVMIKDPLNKWFQWGECEDLEWSKRVLRKGYRYKINPLSVVRIMKPFKDTVFKYMPE